MRKKKVLFQSNQAMAVTGFGKNMKNVLSYLYKTGKYELIEAANLIEYGKDLKRPWRAVGTYAADMPTLAKIGNNPNEIRRNAYGFYAIDKIIQEEKPDFYCYFEDPWAMSGFTEKSWWKNKTLTKMVWTTVDSLPILPEALDLSNKSDIFAVWAPFAEKEMKRLGYNNVFTMPGLVDLSHLYPKSDSDKKFLRQKYKIEEDTYVIGFVFKNQLRKQCMSLLEGFKRFKQCNPDIKTKLVFHTEVNEGPPHAWPIMSFIAEKEIDKNDVLFTHICKKCGEFELKPYNGEGGSCGHCNSEKSQRSKGIDFGITENQLNDLYNLMDINAVLFSSGGMELSAFEGRAAGIPTLITNYSCGELIANEEYGALPVDYVEYREPSSNFLKSASCPESVCRQLERVYKMTSDEKQQFIQKGLYFVKSYCSIETLGKKLEELIDNAPFAKYEDEKPIVRNPDYQPPQIDLKNSTNHGQTVFEWIKDYVKNTLGEDAPDSFLNEIVGLMNKGVQIQDLFNRAQDFCRQIIGVKPLPTLDDLLSKDDDGRRLILVQKESIGDLFIISSLLPSIKKAYPDYNIYIATKPEYHSLFYNNPYVHKILPFHEMMENQLNLIGCADHKGWFEISFHPYTTTQKHLNYLNNGKTNIILNVKK